MEEKPIMTRSGKAISRKNKSNPTTAPVMVRFEQEMIPSQRVFDAIPLAIVSVDWQGGIQYMNKAAKSMQIGRAHV